MSSLICHGCGSTNAPDTSVSYISCEYCGASISVAAFYRGLSANSLESLVDAGLSDTDQTQVSKLMEDASEYMNAGDIPSAKDRLEKLLQIYPKHIPSRLNLAKCILRDTNVDARERSKIVVNHCLNVPEPLKTPEITMMIDGIAFDLASLAIHSVNGLDTLHLFDISHQISGNNKERDVLVEGYVSPVLEKFVTKMRSGIKKKKSSFCPSATELELLLHISKYNEAGKSFCLTMENWISENSKKMHPRALEKLDDLAKIANDFTGDFVVFKVGLFGIKEELKSV